MKKYKLRKNAEFRTVYRKGRSFSNDLLVLYIHKNNRNDFNRFGVSVSKKVGKSVIRNRVRRLIKESYRLIPNNLKKGYDLVVIARTSSRDKNYAEIEKALINLFKKAGLYNS
ncbi:ribonuclease P protein component [Clostridium tetanomorphum]|uniref:Ribonuclease P protein component n=1 Tax=Clostridium tetanomorphum TaxID=1553 RepID=A0A923J1P5_CLOTT|nr:ribonuclease P protein component [Clostridium tetanomorphum]KAJ49567.1 ribonuclease P [Clostridium tetanomorphum DSM 665]KAJ50014.1 ribonuclease P [Clostridium tetanomorphum DSM 665]MBC2399009.1 ribonuclease P protein component [Clostridium tetanomorphum]MBP1866215.1 ribonuclease P protein component [Clostridium tetanomorphum]NRS86593.1 ribonuclease P protein component [Clostridium tetanomorphum]